MPDQFPDFPLTSIPMARLRIDAEQLAYAMEDNDTQWVLDLRTGEVMLAAWARAESGGGAELDPDEDDWDPDDALMDLEDLDPERFRPVDPIPSHETFRWRERFAADQGNDRVRNRLLSALGGRGPFRAFKDALLDFPDVREAWFRYEAERLRREATAWLEAEGIDGELVDGHAAGGPPAQPETE